MSTQLVISNEKAKELYPKASTEFRTMLEETFGKKFFLGKITDRVKSFQDACIELGIDIDDTDFYNLEPDEVAYRKLKIIVRALNEGWTPERNNFDQYQYYPWFYRKQDSSNQSGFQFDSVDWHYQRSVVGSRLCFRSAELAEYAGKQFVTLYKEFLNC
jgi:hypothetical protein